MVAALAKMLANARQRLAEDQAWLSVVSAACCIISHSSRTRSFACLYSNGRVQVKYCSVECQHQHWKQGKHRQDCKMWQAIRSAECDCPAVGARNRGRSSTATSACLFCLEKDPPPIQSGCACRGDAGLAHVECRVKDAQHEERANISTLKWTNCSTCKQMFSSAMQMGLAREHWSEVLRLGLPPAHQVRVTAAVWLAHALLDHDKLVEGEKLMRATVDDVKRFKGPHHLNLMTLYNTLGCTLHRQSKLTQAEVAFRSGIAIRSAWNEKRLLDPVEFARNHSVISSEIQWDDDPFAMNIVAVLCAQGKHEEAFAMFATELANCRQEQGPDHNLTLTCAVNFARELKNVEMFRESEALYVEYMPRVKRVLGPEHPMTLNMALVGATCMMSGDWGSEYNEVTGEGADNEHVLVEAEVLLMDPLEVQTRVSGRNHSQTLLSKKLLSDVRNRLQIFKDVRSAFAPWIQAAQ
jgi:hypothetical protein